MPVNWLFKNGLLPVAFWVKRPRPAPAELTNVPGAVCWAGMRSSPTLPKVS